MKLSKFDKKFIQFSVALDFQLFKTGDRDVKSLFFHASTKMHVRRSHEFKEATLKTCKHVTHVIEREFIGLT